MARTSQTNKTPVSSYSSYFYSKDNLNYILIWGIILLSIKFYSLFVSYTIAKGLVLLAVLITFSLLILHVVYNKGKSIPHNFHTPLILIFISLLMSSIAASYMHNQLFGATLFAQNEFYFFLLYFLLHKLKPKPEKIVDMIIAVGMGACFVYLVEYMIFPTRITSAGILEDRGTVRIFIPGLNYATATYFASLARYSVTKKFKYLIYMVPVIVVFMLLGTRQVMAIVFLLTVLFVLFSRRIKSKFFMFLLMGSAVVSAFFIFQEMFTNLLELTEKQLGDSAGNVRVNASRYFLLRFNDNKIWYLTGNGFPDDPSPYARAISRLTESFGFYLSDIGIVGDLFKFGVLYVFAILFLYFRLLFVPYTDKLVFIRYISLGSILGMVTGAGMQSTSIGLLCLTMYLADICIHKKSKDTTKEKSDAVFDTSRIETLNNSLE